MSRWAACVLPLITVLAWLSPASAPVHAAAPGPLSITVLSNRADLISGGDALIEVRVPAGIDASSVRVDNDGRDVTSAFGAGRIPGLLTAIPDHNLLGVARSDNALIGLVTGLRGGASRLTARLPDGSGAGITITNHPIGGPVFAGPQVQPWLCATQNPPPPPVGAGQPVHLGAPTDAQCDVPIVDEYLYHTSDPVACGGQVPCFAPYDIANPPSSVATTTTDTGVTVPYIVRLESGVEDRGVYSIAVLADPRKPWSAWAPQASWNHKLVVTFGASTAVHHAQAQPSAVVDQPVTTSNPQGPLNWWSPDTALSRGFMVANSGLNVHGEDANDNVSAEAVLMLKEHIRETYGLIRYTIGNGCSGGGLQQYIIAGMYPGLLDGIQPNCSFPDIWTTAQEVFDCVLLINYETAVGTPLAAATAALADGHRDPSDCVAWDATFGTADTPTTAANCALPAADVYNPASNPRGVRCSIQDYQQAIWGPRPQSVWSAVEKQIGAGFAGRPFDNVGVQYGLGALDAGTLTVAQFLDLNARIGGFDIDLVAQAQRNAADPGTVATAYRAGQVTDGRQLATVPIVDLRGWSESSEIHTSFHSYEVRARLDAANGGHGNQIIWTWPAEFPILGIITPAAIAQKSFLLLDSWLTRIEADTGTAPLAEKVVQDKPMDAVDACFPTNASTSPEVTDMSVCDQLFPHYADARIAAGGPLVDNVLKCALKQPAPSDYGVTFSAAEWQQLHQVFPTGVCDRSRPGVDQQPSTPWMTFAGGPGGRPLGAAPVSDVLALTSGTSPRPSTPPAAPNTSGSRNAGADGAVVGAGVAALWWAALFGARRRRRRR